MSSRELVCSTHCVLNNCLAVLDRCACGALSIALSGWRHVPMSTTVHWSKCTCHWSKCNLPFVWFFGCHGTLISFKASLHH